MKTPTSVDVRAVRIYSANGRSFDAAYIFDEIILNESLYMPTMNGSITITDDFDHYEALPIIGQEIVQIEVEAFEERIYTFTFAVYKVSNVQKLNSRTSRYTLYFVSEEQILNENLRLTRSFANMKYSQMMNEILVNEIGTEKDIAIDATQNSNTYVTPNIRPFKAIKQITRKSISARNEQSNYVFFEDRRGFIAAPLMSLALAEPKYQYRMNENVSKDNNQSPTIADPLTIFKLDISKQTDTLSLLSNGLFASSLYTIDPIRRKIESYDYDYFSEFDSADHMNEHPLFVEQDYFSREGNQYFTYTTENIQDSDYVKSHDSSIVPEQSSLFRMKRRIQNQSFSNYVLNMSIPGNALLFVGDVIEIDMVAAANKRDERRNRMISGKNLVSSITHVLTGSRGYIQRIETVKDSVVQQLSEEP